jgi:hypothetical protein
MREEILQVLASALHEDHREAYRNDFQEMSLEQLAAGVRLTAELVQGICDSVEDTLGPGSYAGDERLPSASAGGPQESRGELVVGRPGRGILMA